VKRDSAIVSPPAAPGAVEGGTSRRRLLAGVAFAAFTLGVSVLLARRLTHTSWPLERAHMGLVSGAVALYFTSYVLRALGWQKLFPVLGRPGRGRCLTACGAAAASGVILPFRLDYVVKVSTLRRMPGVKLGLEAIVFSIISLGLVDAVAFLPLSISATATSSAGFRGPLILVVLFGVGACGILVAGPRLVTVPFVAQRERLSRLARRVADHPGGTTRDAILAWLFLLGCWTARASGSTLLLAALGAGFSPVLALVVLCLAAAASLIPVTSGGVIANVGATAAVLLALGVHRQEAINFGLASGLLLSTTAAAAAVVGLASSFALSRRPPALARATG
jgi:Lysylphosphatidylglycerol synthase TM region